MKSASDILQTLVGESRSLIETITTTMEGYLKFIMRDDGNKDDNNDDDYVIILVQTKIFEHHFRTVDHL